MAVKNYMDDETVRKYYQTWALSPTTHPMDMEKFYKFVKACVRFAGHEDLGRKLDITYLRAHLYDSFHDKYTEEYYDKFTHKIVVLFEHLRDYEDTTLP
jgi:hypothetical protein